jgi:hypothetical protein
VRHRNAVKFRPLSGSLTVPACRGRATSIAVLSLLLAAAAPLLFAIQNDPTPPAIDEIIRRFAEKEKEFKLARANYTFRQDIRVQELDSRGNPVFDEKGNILEYRAVTDILFNNKGQRIEKNVEGPTNRLRRYKLTKEDFEDFRSVQPFVLTVDELPQYRLTYTGREHVEEIDCFVFQVAPKQIQPDKRYFDGTIWVDQAALQIVKTFGKAVPDLGKGLPGENLFPRFTTYRHQVDGKYWFPAYTFADDTLQFKLINGGPTRIRYVIKYENYKQFVSDVKIIPERK